MTQSVAVGSLHRVKWRAWVCVWVRTLNKSNLISSDSWASLSACICDALPLCVCAPSKRWRQRANETEWLLTVGHSMSTTLWNKVTKPFLAGATSYCWQRRRSSFTGNTTCDTLAYPKGWIMTLWSKDAPRHCCFLLHGQTTGKSKFSFSSNAQITTENTWMSWCIYSFSHASPSSALCLVDHLCSIFI